MEISRDQQFQLLKDKLPAFPKKPIEQDYMDRWFVLVNIGMMIEFLDDGYWYCLNISRQLKKDNKRMKKPRWGIFDVGTFWSDRVSTNGFIKYELCDALWMAVKEVLEA